MKFPQEYPLTNHPNTIVLVKNNSTRGIEANFKFPQQQTEIMQKENKLEVAITLPSAEVILEFK